MIDDREAQAAMLARARANPASGLPLSIQDRIGIYRRMHGDEAADALIAAYRRIPERKQLRTTPAEALKIKARQDADEAAASELLELIDLDYDYTTEYGGYL